LKNTKKTQGAKMILGVIPARLCSTRLYKKILKDINGKPMIIHTADAASKSLTINKLVIAVDNENVKNTIESYGYDVLLTSVDCKSGTDRVNQAADFYKDADIIINIQADEPLLDYRDIDKLTRVFNRSMSVDMATLVSTRLTMNELSDTGVVKAYVDSEGYAWTFNRDPFYGETLDNLGGIYKHIGIYAFRRDALKRFTMLEQTDNEKIKKLEQLRAIDNNIRIKAVVTSHDYLSVDTETDLKRVKQRINSIA